MRVNISRENEKLKKNGQKEKKNMTLENKQTKERSLRNDNKFQVVKQTWNKNAYERIKEKIVWFLFVCTAMPRRFFFSKFIVII